MNSNNRVFIPEPASYFAPRHYPIRDYRPDIDTSVIQVFYRDLEVYECIHCHVLVVDHGTLHRCPCNTNEVDCGKLYVDTILQKRLVSLLQKGFRAHVVGFTCED